MSQSLEFRHYESRPITRLAHEIQENDTILETTHPNQHALVNGEFTVSFKTHEDPQVGDFVVYAGAHDVYLCPRAVFLERNIVEEDND